jgi:Spy/CpxP family protein refolding chaperone
MARTLKGTLTLCLALGLTSAALGQQGRQPPQPSVLGPVLSNPDVQKELKLSDEQVNKLKDAIGKVMDKYKDDFAKLQRMTPEEQQKKFHEISQEGDKAVAGILDAGQMKRYRQIEWQLQGIGALVDPTLQKELKLSDEQKKKLDDIFKEAGKKQQELMRNPGATREEAQRKHEEFVKDIEAKANGVLSEEQKKNLKELKGPQFQFSQQKGGR